MRRSVVFVSKGESASSTRYRALQFFPLWESAGFVPSHATASGGVAAFLRMLRATHQADVVVVLRKTFPPPLLWLLRKAARKLIFDFDDAIFCNTDGTSSKTRMSRFVAMVGCCDGVWAGNGFLAQQAKSFNQAVAIMPTCLRPERYLVHANKAEDAIDLVWIGSSSTKKYLDAALPLLEAAARKTSGLRLKIIADFDLPDAGLPTLPIAWSAATEAQELASAHIGIAPMPDNDWSRGKCALKVLQYMAAGLPVVSSNSGANAEIVQEGVTGYLASSTDEWAEAIARLAKNAQLRQQMGEAGRGRVEKAYSLVSVFERERANLDALLEISG